MMDLEWRILYNEFAAIVESLKKASCSAVEKKSMYAQGILQFI